MGKRIRLIQKNSDKNTMAIGVKNPNTKYVMNVMNIVSSKFIGNVAADIISEFLIVAPTLFSNVTANS